ncbi:MAG TPA: hypothetical protein VFP20_09845 [Bacteroidales bacterium]|nr:hypothetical protein [Bacteroidales bacterium]
MNWRGIRFFSLVFVLVVSFVLTAFTDKEWQSKFISYQNNRLIYHADEKGDIIPDFSRVGYHLGDQDIPKVEVVKTLSPTVGGESQTAIQSAIDEVSRLPLNSKGLRGAILLKKGTYLIPGSIRISSSGIVLYGEGNGPDGTQLIATGTDKRSVLKISGTGKLQQIGEKVKITDAYVPVGTFSFKVADVRSFKIGDEVAIFRPGTDAWIHDLKMDSIEARSGTRQWSASEYDFHFERVITKIEGNTVYLNNPVVMSMEVKYGGGYLYKCAFEGRISEIGVENILFKSEYKSDTDEDHSWTAIDFSKTQNAWVRNIVSKCFAYSLVSVGSDAKMITIDHCKNLEQKSIITGGRRYSFNICGQMNLVKNCEASEGRHDYVTGAKVCGPNVFYNCSAVRTHADIGPHHRWAVGTLYDHIVTDGSINVQDRGNWGSGHGWAGATQVLWNCTAPKVCLQNPWVSAKNYCIGLKGQVDKGRLSGRPNGEWEGLNESSLLQPASLYLAQLKQRKGEMN